MGVFEFEAFAKGTNGIATTLAELTGKGCITIIGNINYIDHRKCSFSTNRRVIVMHIFLDLLFSL
jgi:3-phosphoglycerate kinase